MSRAQQMYQHHIYRKKNYERYIGRLPRRPLDTLHTLTQTPSKSRRCQAITFLIARNPNRVRLASPGRQSVNQSAFKLATIRTCQHHLTALWRRPTEPPHSHTRTMMCFAPRITKANQVRPSRRRNPNSCTTNLRPGDTYRMNTPKKPGLHNPQKRLNILDKDDIILDKYDIP